MWSFVVHHSVAEMRVSASKSEAMVLCRKPGDCSLWAGTDYLPQVKEFENHESVGWIRRPAGGLVRLQQ